MNKFTLILIVLFMAIAAYSQVELKPAIGINVSNVSKDRDTGSATGQVGYQVGANSQLFYGNFLT